MGRQILKLDCISEELKPYFLDRVSSDDEHKEYEDLCDNQWTVSFEKLSFLFPNLKQIHFMNSYRLDNETLQRLIDWLQHDGCKLEQIKFMYYDYEGSLDD